jgi:DNA-binding winged helix-turn-helix (wHTH) protein
MGAKEFYTALNQARSKGRIDYSPQSEEERSTLAYHLATRAIQDGNLSLLQELEQTLPEGHLLRQFCKIRLAMFLETHMELLNIAKNFNLVDRARTDEGPYEAWLLEALCLQSYVETDAIAGKSQRHINEEILQLSLKVLYHPAIRYGLDGLLLEAHRRNNLQELLRLRSILSEQIDRFGLSQYRLELLHSELVSASAYGDSKRILELKQQIDQTFHLEEQSEQKWLRLDDKILEELFCLRGLVRSGNVTATKKILDGLMVLYKTTPLRGYRHFHVFEKIHLALRVWSTDEIHRFITHLPKHNLEDHQRILALSHAYLEIRFNRKSPLPLLEILDREKEVACANRSDCEVAIALLNLKHLGPSDDWWLLLRRFQMDAESAPNPLEVLQWFWVELDGQIIQNSGLKNIINLLNKIAALSLAGNFLLDHEAASALLSILENQPERSLRNIAEDSLEEVAGKRIAAERAATWPLKDYLERNLPSSQENARQMIPPAPTQELQLRFFRALVNERDRVVPKEKIVRAVWSEAYDPRIHDGRLQKLVAKIRAHIEHFGYSPDQVEAISGEGYRFCTGPQSEANLQGETRDKAILAWIESLPQDTWFTSADLSRKFGQSQRQSQRDIKRLESIGLLESEGKARQKRYRFFRQVLAAA